MTDAEKMLQLMMHISEEELNKQQEEFNHLGRLMRMMYDGYTKAGFSSKMAFELVKITIMASFQSSSKKE